MNFHPRLIKGKFDQVFTPNFLLWALKNVYCDIEHPVLLNG